MTIKTLNSLSLPVENDVLLTVPQFTDWAKLTEKNSKLVTQSRKELLRAAINYTKTTIDMPCPTEDLRCTVVTGHQPEWHHCGIAAKSIVSYHLAQKLGAYCIHLILDHDTGSSKLRMPVIQKNKWAIKEFELENDCDKLPFEFRSSAQLDQILTFVDACVADHKYFCQSAWQEIRAKLTIGKFRNLADTIMFLQAKVYAKMGIDMLYLPVSKMSSTKVFLYFAASIIKDAESFVNIYNKAIGNSKNNDGYKPRMLKIDCINKTFELPFWVVSSHGKRMSLFVNINQVETILLADDREFLRGDLGNIDLSCFEIKEALQRHGWYLRPKALTLTLFVRMYFADWFVHGIGGAKYEPIVDCILKEYFGIEKLHFGVATSTVRWKMRKRDSVLEKLRQRQRKMQYEPESFLKNNCLKVSAHKNILMKKKELVVASRNGSLPQKQRQQAWKKIRQINEQLFQGISHDFKQLEESIRCLEQEEKISLDRTFFFGLFDKEKLRTFASI